MALEKIRYSGKYDLDVSQSAASPSESAKNAPQEEDDLNMLWPVNKTDRMQQGKHVTA